MSSNNISLFTTPAPFPEFGYAASSSSSGSSSHSEQIEEKPHLWEHSMQENTYLDDLEPKSCGSLIVSCGLDWITATKIADFIKKAPELFSLTFELADSQFCESDLNLIVTALVDCKKLENIAFMRQTQPLTKLPLITFADVISKSQPLKQLEITDISQVDDEGLVAVFKAIGEINRSLESIVMYWDSSNRTLNLSRVVITAIADALIKNPVLQEFELNGQFSIAYEDMALFGRAIALNTGLRKLTLEACTLGGEHRIQLIDDFRALILGLKDNKSLEEVNLLFLETMGGTETANALFDFLASNHTIKRLNLESTINLDHICVQKIFEALKSNNTLEILGLRGIEVGENQELINTLTDSMENNPFYSTVIEDFFEKDSPIFQSMNVHANNGRIRQRYLNRSFLHTLLEECEDNDRISVQRRLH